MGLALPSDVGRPVLRVGLNEQVTVVVRKLQRENVVPKVFCCLTEQCSHIFFDHGETGVAVIRTPHEVILTGTNRIRVTAILLYR